MQEEPATLPIGAVIRKRYLVEGLLGKGGSGAVYLVRDQRVRFAKDNLFVLKKIKGQSQRKWYRLTFEDVSLKRLYHHALPRVHRVFNDDTHDWVYMVMEYIEGPNLEMLRQQQPEKRFSYLEAMNFMGPIIDAVSYLHRQQPPMIHRDIKPTDIIVPKTGARAVLVDFGIDKKYGPVSTSGMVHSNTPNYKAPELYSGGGDIRTDIYGLGATFYTLLTSIVPADARSRMTQSGSTGIDPLEPVNKVVPAVPMRIGKAIDRAMSLDPHRRFSSVERFWEELWSLVEHPVSMSDMPSALAGPPAVSIPTPEPERAVEHDAAAMLLPKPQPVVSMADSAKEPEDLDATEPLPKLPPVVSTPDAVKEREGPGTTKPLPEPPQIVLVPDTVKEQEDLDATEPLPKLPPVVPMSISIKEQEDLDDVMLLPMPPRTERASISWRKLGALFIALTLLISLGIGAIFLFYKQSHPAAHSTTPSPTAISPAHTPTSTSASAIYPTLAGTYTGTIYDISVNMSTTMSLTRLRQSQGNISGYLILGPKLQGGGPFSGTVDTAKNLQFTMTDAAGNATLFFEGAMQSATILSGDYYSCDHPQGSQCHRAPGSYGIWSVTVASSGEQLAQTAPFRLL